MRNASEDVQVEDVHNIPMKSSGVADCVGMVMASSARPSALGSIPLHAPPGEADSTPVNLMYSLLVALLPCYNMVHKPNASAPWDN